jgi:hypothetical protein
MTKHDDELAELKAKVAALEAKSTPAPVDPRETERRIAEWQNEVHQMRERRMALASNFHPDDLRAMEAACPTSAIKDIVSHGTVQSPGYGHRAQASRAEPSPSATPGWQEPRPLSNPPGTKWVDAIAIADEVRQRKGKG